MSARRRDRIKDWLVEGFRANESFDTIDPDVGRGQGEAFRGVYLTREADAYLVSVHAQPSYTGGLPAFQRLMQENSGRHIQTVSVFDEACFFRDNRTRKRSRTQGRALTELERFIESLGPVTYWNEADNVLHVRTFRNTEAYALDPSRAEHDGQRAVLEIRGEYQCSTVKLPQLEQNLGQLELDLQGGYYVEPYASARFVPIQDRRDRAAARAEYYAVVPEPAPTPTLRRKILALSSAERARASWIVQEEEGGNDEPRLLATVEELSMIKRLLAEDAAAQ